MQVQNSMYGKIDVTGRWTTIVKTVMDDDSVLLYSLSVFTCRLLQRTLPARKFLSLSKCWWLPLMYLTFSSLVLLILIVFLFQCKNICY
jgi:hypothetical protein